MTDTTRLTAQLRFIRELDRLKSVERMTSLIGGARRENSAEHSWHLAVMTPLLVEHATDDVDVLRAQTMVLIHDVVEIEAGDAFAFDAQANVGQEDRERRAAEKLFGMLPEDQATHFRALWEEFEARDTPDSRFALAMDRFQALLMNHGNEGGTWKSHDVSRERVLERMEPIREVAPALWDVVLQVVEAAGLRD